MEIEQVAEMARAVAALPQAERDFFDGMVADTAAAAVERKLFAELRAMSDLDAVRIAIRSASQGWDLETLPERVLQALRDAGFMREVPAFREGVVYNKGDRVLVRGRIYECLSDRVTGFYRCEGDPTVEVPRLTTPNWQAVGESA